MADYTSDAKRRRRTASGNAPDLPDGNLGPLADRWMSAGAGAVDPYNLTTTALDQVYPAGAEALRARKEQYPDAAAVGGLMSPLNMLPAAAAARGGAAVLNAARANPTAAGSLMAGIVAASPSAIGADDDGLTSSQRERRDALNAKLSKGGLKRNERDELKGLNDLTIEFSKKQNEAAQDVNKAKVLEADAVRRDMLDKADKPFAKQFPVWNSVQPFVPLALGAATTAPFLTRAAIGEQKAVNAWQRAADKGLKATSADDLAQSSNLTNAYASQFKDKPKGVAGIAASYPVPAAVGAVEGAVASNLPEMYNAFLPSENPERSAYAEYIKRLPPGATKEALHAKGIMADLPKVQPERDAAFDHFGSSSALKRTAIGALDGAGGGIFSATMTKGLTPSTWSRPTAQTEALAARMSGAGLDDATRAIQAETQAMGSMLPMRGERAQMPPQPIPQPMPAANGGLLDSLPPQIQQQFPRSLPQPDPVQAMPSVQTKLPPTRNRFDPRLYESDVDLAAGTTSRTIAAENASPVLRSSPVSPAGIGQDPGAAPQTAAATRRRYPEMGSPERESIRDHYRGAVSDAGGPLNPRDVNRVIQGRAGAEGASLPDVSNRVAATNQYLEAFRREQGRYPSTHDEWSKWIYRNTGTLAAPPIAAAGLLDFSGDR